MAELAWDADKWAKYEDAVGADTPGSDFGSKTEVDSSIPYQVYYTSGTTGKPKRVILSLGIVCKHAIGTIDAMRINKNDIWGHFAPMFHLVDATTLVTSGFHPEP